MAAGGGTRPAAVTVGVQVRLDATRAGAFADLLPQMLELDGVTDAALTCSLDAPVELPVVDAVGRLQLVARRAGAELVIRCLGGGYAELVAWTGLETALPRASEVCGDAGVRSHQRWGRAFCETVGMHAQPGIFALGTIEHAYVELDLAPGRDAADLVTVLAALTGPETTISGVNAVVAFRPELWAEVAPDYALAEVRSFEEISGAGLVMPATQHDAWLWIAGGSRDVVFDSTLRVLHQLDGLATVASEVGGWLYQHTRDLTGFIDGTENPAMIEAPEVAVAADGPGAGASVLLYQQWRHEESWERLPVAEQEKVIGRTKADSIELDEAAMPADSHVSRNVVEEDGEELAIYRRNTAYGGVTDHGTVFVAFCATQHPLDIMLRRMAGEGDGIRDALTRHTTPLRGAYYVVPSLPALAAFGPDDVDG